MTDKINNLEKKQSLSTTGAERMFMGFLSWFMLSKYSSHIEFLFTDLENSI